MKSNDSKLMYCFKYPVRFNCLNKSIRRDILIMHITQTVTLYISVVLHKGYT